MECDGFLASLRVVGGQVLRGVVEVSGSKNAALAVLPAPLLCRGVVLNPFKGYEENERNILDPRLTETVKEFCAIDGAFLLRGDGVIEAAGAFLHPGLPREELPMGLGARHAAAAGITAVTNAIAITVSASTGTVRVFRSGRMVLEIERPS